jgi:hypothetical protein
MPAVLTAFWNGHEKFKKKIGKPSHCVIYVTKLPGKIINLQYSNYFKKVFSEMSYHVWRFMAFKPNNQSYGHIQSIVCSNDLILCTRVHVGMTNNVAKGSFHFICTKIWFSFFRVLEMGFFVNDLPNICCKIGTTHFYKILVHIQCTIDQMVGCQNVSIHLSWKRQNSTDSVGSGSNLN